MDLNPRPAELPQAPFLPSGIRSRWTWHYRILSTLRDQLLGDAIACGWDATESPRPLDFFSGTTARHAEFEILLERVKQEHQPLFELEAALQRLHRGTYGRCELTRRPIPAARLRMIPWCRFKAPTWLQ